MKSGIDTEVIFERIQRPQPEGRFIVEGSTPVVSFGNLLTAKVVTLGIHPSVDEFRSRKRDRSTLAPERKRLVDYETLGLRAGSLLHRDHAERVLQGCLNYFNTKNHYSWFNRMEEYVAKPLGFSYLNNEVAHIDLVQWATDPVWQNIHDKQVSDSLIRDDLPFLDYILKKGSFEHILLNGKTVLNTVKSLDLFDFTLVDEIVHSGGTSGVYEAKFGQSLVTAWTMNVPGRLTNQAREELALWLASRYAKA